MIVKPGKTESALPKKSTLTPEMTNKLIAEQEQMFGNKMSKVDESKTKREVNNDGSVKYTYYDKSGKVLYTKTEQCGLGNETRYETQNPNGDTLRLRDFDDDGIIDQMIYRDHNHINSFDATDLDDNGTFDVAIAFDCQSPKEYRLGPHL